MTSPNQATCIQEWLQPKELEEKGVVRKESFAHGHAYRVIHEDLKQYILLEVLCICGLPAVPGRAGYFPGLQPISMSQNQMVQLLTEEYFVTEKTDGTRYFMLCLSWNGLFTILMDRSLQFWMLDPEALYIPPEMTSLYAGSVLDGELVPYASSSSSSSSSSEGHNKRSLQKYAFLVFDVLAINRRCLVGESTEKRYKNVLIRLFQGKLSSSSVSEGNERSSIASGNSSSSSSVKGLENIVASWKGIRSIPKRSPFILALKTHYGLDLMRSVYASSAHTFACDGLIFTPNAMSPLSIGAPNESLFKWKPGQQNTIDLYCKVVEHSNGEYMELYLLKDIHPITGNIELEWYQTYASADVFPHKTAKEKEPWPEYRKQTPAQRALVCHEQVIEVRFRNERKVRSKKEEEEEEEEVRSTSEEEGLEGVEFVTIRHDKTAPNNRRTVSATRQNFLENISFEELCRFLESSHHVLSC